MIAAAQKAIKELIQRNLEIYLGSQFEARLSSVLKSSPTSGLKRDDLIEMIRLTRPILFDGHFEVVSGHHTDTYIRFESIARYPDVVERIGKDMASWAKRAFDDERIDAVLAPDSAARLLAEAVAKELVGTRVVLAPYNWDTGRIGAELDEGSLRQGEHVLVMNDVTTRGACVQKLAGIASKCGAGVKGMLVFAKRDSGQFQLVCELMDRYPFYYAADLNMPQWDPAECKLCASGRLLISWKDAPEM